jgi:Tim10/DDP family zinc finger
MGWFGGGSSKEQEEAPASETGFSELGGGSFAGETNMSYGNNSGSSGASSSGLQEFQEFSLQLQQQVLVQQVITELAHKAFEKCCTASTRDNALAGKEVACISAVTNKWLDANEFLAGRLQRKQQQAAGQHQQFG